MVCRGAHPDGSTGRDGGFTLPELLITIAMMGLVAAVISAAIIVIFRSEAGVVRLTAESHDTQQGVNYFPLDVQAGPLLPGAYDTSAAAAGCVPEGENVLQFDKGDKRIAYRLTVNGAVGRLDRHVCELIPLSAPPAYSPPERVNVADRLDASLGVAAVATLITSGAYVQSIELRLAQEGSDALIVASPRGEPRNSPGDCQTNNPIESAHGYGVFVEQDVLLMTGSMTGWLGLGGVLTWHDNITIASGNMSAVSPAYGLFAGSIDWVGDGAAPPEVLEVAREKAAIGGTFHQDGDFVYEFDGSADNYLELSGPGNPAAESTAAQIDFVTDFEELRDCSAQLARLLDICAIAGCANEVEVNVSGTTVEACTDDPVPQVLNVPESFFDGTYSFDTGGVGCQGFSQSRPLIINVIDDGDLTVNISASKVDWQALGDRKNILFNFPNSTHVTVADGFWGQILAPFAHVETLGAVEGGVVAKSWTHHGGIVDSNDDLFDNSIIWP